MQIDKQTSRCYQQLKKGENSSLGLSLYLWYVHFSTFWILIQGSHRCILHMQWYSSAGKHTFLKHDIQ